MDSRLRRVGGKPLKHLRRSDAPRVAQAITDYLCGGARVLSGIAGDTSYVEFVKDKSYTVAIRGDDWRKVFPFLRYSSNDYTPVEPPGNPPEPVLSPQPNRTMQPPPENPGGGLRSFLDKLPFHEYQQIQRLLSTLSVDSLDRLRVESRPSRPAVYPTDLYPTDQRRDAILKDGYLYEGLVLLLQALFPDDYPTTI
jgi:hypothetical protein